MNFLNILLEAKGDKKPKAKKITIAPDDTETTDYTNEEDDTPDDDPSDTEEETTEDDEASDYTEEEDEVDPEEDGETADELDSTEDEPTDYSSEPSDDETPEGDPEDTEEPVEGEPDPEIAKEHENNRILMDDYINVFYTVKNMISKLSSIDKSNIVINMIVTQITSNLNMLEKQLFEYITFTFASNKYVTNLYKYNYFLEALKINVQMLKKISVFIPK